MAAKFEKVSKYANHEFAMPKRATMGAAGYDFVAAEDTIVPSFFKICPENVILAQPLSLDAISELTKKYKFKPTLVPTGVKCRLDESTYLKLVNRSSNPLKYWLILANGEGIIDADYYNNPDNEGSIYFQFINLSPWDIIINKGERIGQGIIEPYLRTEDDFTTEARIGGFGSTSK